MRLVAITLYTNQHQNAVKTHVHIHRGSDPMKRDIGVTCEILCYTVILSVYENGVPIHVRSHCVSHFCQVCQ